MRFVAIFAFASLLSSVSYAPTSSTSADTCDRVAATLKLADTKVTATHVVTGGQFTPPAAAGERAPRPIDGLPAFCRVELTLTPSSDSDIKSEVWMPLSGWNGKFQQVGNGAFAGSIQYAALAEALKRG